MIFTCLTVYFIKFVADRSERKEKKLQINGQKNVTYERSVRSSGGSSRRRVFRTINQSKNQV